MKESHDHWVFSGWKLTTTTTEKVVSAEFKNGEAVVYVNQAEILLGFTRNEGFLVDSFSKEEQATLKRILLCRIHQCDRKRIIFDMGIEGAITLDAQYRSTAESVYVLSLYESVEQAQKAWLITCDVRGSYALECYGQGGSWGYTKQEVDEMMQMSLPELEKTLGLTVGHAGV